MDNLEISQLVGQVGQEDKVRLVTHHNAVVKNTKAYQSDPTEARLRNLRAAEQALADEVKRLQPEKEDQGSPDDRFANRLEAWQYLQDSGWQIGRSQFYAHCKEGRLRREKDGSYLRERVDKYAELHCRLAETGERVNDRIAKMAEEKATTELEREKVRLQKEQHDLALRLGDYVARDEVELMIVGRAVAMLSHLKAMVQMRAGDLIELVEGKQERVQELIAVLHEHIEDHLAVFAKDIEFDIIFEKNSSSEERDE